MSPENTPASSSQACNKLFPVAWRGVELLPCHYLHNRGRKLGTNQLTTWSTFTSSREESLEISIRWGPVKCSTNFWGSGRTGCPLTREWKPTVRFADCPPRCAPQGSLRRVPFTAALQ